MTAYNQIIDPHLYQASTLPTIRVYGRYERDICFLDLFYVARPKHFCFKNGIPFKFKI